MLNWQGAHSNLCCGDGLLVVVQVLLLTQSEDEEHWVSTFDRLEPHLKMKGIPLKASTGNWLHTNVPRVVVHHTLFYFRITYRGTFPFFRGTVVLSARFKKQKLTYYLVLNERGEALARRALQSAMPFAA